MSSSSFCITAQSAIRPAPSPWPGWTTPLRSRCVGIRLSTLQSHQRLQLRLRQTVWSAWRLARKLARVAVGSGPAVEPQLREAPVMNEGSWVGLDVHARSVVAGVIDAGSGEVRSLRLPPRCERDGRVAADAAGAGSGRVRGGADWVRACACVCRGRDQLRCRGAVADPGGGRPGQDRSAGRRAAGEVASAG